MHSNVSSDWREATVLLSGDIVGEAATSALGFCVFWLVPCFLR